jgi:hypothetical protein
VKQRPSVARSGAGDDAEARGGGDVDPRLAAFLRGVTIGALVGAAIAGSALWERALRRRGAAEQPAGEDVSPPS